jgi:hypothetical protein
MERGSKWDDVPIWTIGVTVSREIRIDEDIKRGDDFARPEDVSWVMKIGSCLRDKILF